ncbi:hypothetical protein L345_15999, partial [Ophiophagus hannah]
MTKAGLELTFSWFLTHNWCVGARWVPSSTIGNTASIVGSASSWVEGLHRPGNTALDDEHEGIGARAVSRRYAVMPRPPPLVRARFLPGGKHTLGARVPRFSPPRDLRFCWLRAKLTPGTEFWVTFLSRDRRHFAVGHVGALKFERAPPNSAADQKAKFYDFSAMVTLNMIKTMLRLEFLAPQNSSVMTISVCDAFPAPFECGKENRETTRTADQLESKTER